MLKHQICPNRAGCTVYRNRPDPIGNQPFRAGSSARQWQSTVGDCAVLVTIVKGTQALGRCAVWGIARGAADHAAHRIQIARGHARPRRPLSGMTIGTYLDANTNAISRRPEGA
jgi:hypothetical protein